MEQKSLFSLFASLSIQAAAQAQDRIGWSNLLHGQLAVAWSDLQHGHLTSIAASPLDIYILGSGCGQATFGHLPLPLGLLQSGGS